MQPPFYITGDPNADWIIFVIGALVCVYWLRALRLAREGARLFLRNLAFAVLAFIGCQFMLAGMQVPHDNAVVLSGIGAGSVRRPQAKIPTISIRFEIRQTSGHRQRFEGRRIQPGETPH